VVPDVEIEVESVSRLTSLILMQDVIFEYVNGYVYKKDSISLPESFHITEQEYEDFVSYVSDKEEFEYATASEIKLTELKEIAEQEGLLSELKAQVLVLEKGLKGDLKRDLDRYKSQIIPILENEIISRYFYQRGKSIHSFSFDRSLLTAKEILNKTTEYNTILGN
jgi:carboxyl-terminal processing protease